jgi:hypothetical protein
MLESYFHDSEFLLGHCVKISEFSNQETRGMIGAVLPCRSINTVVGMPNWTKAYVRLYQGTINKPNMKY